MFAGTQEARGQFAAIMDADLSHDPEELPDMLARAMDGYDVVIGSRYVKGAMFVGQPMTRRMLSVVLNVGTRGLLMLPHNDVLTGFAVCRRDLVTAMPTHFSSSGFKWLLELLATRRGLRVYEWPIVFRDRKAGTSKASAKEAVALATLCMRLTWRRVGRRTA